ncbi:MAG: ATP-binding protein [Gemmataceae bacterium]|nr:ATP-binding protein [Gemmataceae bacterium]MDW8266270.1 ATP-binding protein [Gemmataceae bacterium]
MPRLIVIKGIDEGRQFELTGPTVSIGRDASQVIRLRDTEVSRRHAELRRQEDGSYRLVDVGSVNGTFLNKQPIKDAPLQSGDHIQIGQSILVYSAGRNAAPTSSDLAERISMITRHDVDLPSAIVKTIAESEGSRILAHPEQADTPWLRTALANLGIMYEAIQAVSHILDIDQLLERIMDLISRSIAADRGCIMLRHPDSGQLEPKAIRWWRDAGREEKFFLSHTIVEYVLRERKGVLVSDAAVDQRFNTGASIQRLGIREVICVPMKGRHETVGVLYLDTRSPLRDVVDTASASVKFTEDHLALAIAIAHQAALAVEETRYHQAMVQAERLAAIGQTIAALSHHIKNILQGLRSGSDILKMGLANMDDQLLQQGWRIVEKNQAKIYDLVMDMLSYSKEREPAIEETDLNQLVQDVLELVRGRAKEVNARLETRLDEQLPRVPCDAEGIHRALLNIVTNALDAVEDRPNATVGVATQLEPEGTWARIIVVDNGVGVPAHKINDIFKPFVSTKGSKGTGLGLPVSRKILREHGGDILVQSQPGKGSKFVLRLPLRSPLTSSEVRSATPAAPPGE